MHDEIPSKTRKKQAMHELQALGAALVALPDGSLASLSLPDSLAQAIAEARRIPSREGKRRQLQYIGRLMRDVDPEPIRAETPPPPPFEKPKPAVKSSHLKTVNGSPIEDKL